MFQFQSTPQKSVSTSCRQTASYSLFDWTSTGSPIIENLSSILTYLRFRLQLSYIRNSPCLTANRAILIYMPLTRYNSRTRTWILFRRFKNAISSYNPKQRAQLVVCEGSISRSIIEWRTNAQLKYANESTRIKLQFCVLRLCGANSGFLVKTWDILRFMRFWSCK